MLGMIISMETAPIVTVPAETLPLPEGWSMDVTFSTDAVENLRVL